MINDFIIEEHVKRALDEDVRYGDLTTDFLVDENAEITVNLNSRANGIFCGKRVFEMVFEILSKDKVKVEFFKKDGDRIEKGEKIATISGNARLILIGERTALNYVQRMSGIATLTAEFIKAINNKNVKLADTRKTTPCFRIFEKYSAQVGGANLHRFNLSDCVMIKDNHIAYHGSIKNAVSKVREKISHAHKIEVECDTKNQVIEALEAKADIIMLDNMPKEQIKECIELINKKAIVEVSGNVKLDTIGEIAKLNPDVISTSAIEAGAKMLDLGFDM